MLGLDSGWSPRGEFPLLTQPLVVPDVPWPLCGPHASVSFLPPPSHDYLLRVSVLLSVCLVRTLVIGFGAHLDNPG